MPDLLLELFSEEIPARMQLRAADDLRRLVTDALFEAGLTYEGAKGFATPRRLALSVHGVTARSADVTEERKGPRVGAPEKAIEGFLRGAGLASIDQASVESDPKKGDFYVARIVRPGRAAEEIVAEIVPAIVRDFPWPKSMRWGARSAPTDSPFAGRDAEGTSSLRWVRPLRSILCTFGPETEEPVVVHFDIAGVVSGNRTYGHRFMAGGEPIVVRRFDDYEPKLQAAKVVLDHERRQAVIETEAKQLAFARGLELVEDRGLLEEVAGLVEWPVVLMGAFDEAFLTIPEEVIRLTIRQNQKCFVLRKPETSGLSSRFGRQAETGTHDHSGQPDGSGIHGSRTGAAAPSGMTEGETGTDLPHGEVRARSASLEPSGSLANRFLLVANIEASDGGRAIVAGNERVIAARLADARFFWEQDLKVPLEEHAKKLETITFHEKLGSQAERVERIARLARELAPLVGANPDDAERAARLCKADLTTGMVGEFPELQGVMGRYYFLAQNGLSPLSRSPSDLSSRFGRQAETGTHGQLEAPGVHGSRTGADAPSGMTEGEAEQGRPSPPHPEVRAERASKDEGDSWRLHAIANAIRDHYKPQGPNDAVPSEPASIAVALADKLDTLVGFWAIDGKPTGSKDPYALRRAALGVIKAVIERQLRISLFPLFTLADHQLLMAQLMVKYEDKNFLLDQLRDHGFDFPEEMRSTAFLDFRELKWVGNQQHSAYVIELLSFFADRLKVHLRETGARHDLIDAVFALPGQDDLLMIVRRVEALGKFLDSDDGANLLVGYRRAANILRAEEKKDGAGAFDAAPDHHLIEERGLPEECALFHVMQAAESHAREHVANEDFEGAMRALAELRPAVDAFFDKVTVNAGEPELRANRLKLLNMLRSATLAVADFSKIGG